MRRLVTILFAIAALLLAVAPLSEAAQKKRNDPRRDNARPSGGGQSSFWEIPPRNLIDIPTAGTLPRGYWTAIVRLGPQGGALGYIDIGLSNRFLLGLSFGGTHIISNDTPEWNSGIGINLKFRIIDELEYFPAVTLGYASQGTGPYNEDIKRYTFKSRGFYGVVSRGFYFYNWTAGGHFGANYSLENEVDDENDLNFFAGFDATFQYNLALTAEWDAALNDDRSAPPDTTLALFAGKGRGYLSIGIKWLFTDQLELEFILKDLLVNRREYDTFGREVRITYIDSF